MRLTWISFERLSLDVECWFCNNQQFTQSEQT